MSVLDDLLALVSWRRPARIDVCVHSRCQARCCTQADMTVFAPRLN